MFGMFESKPDIKKMAAERDIKGLLETLQNQNKKFARERADAAKVLQKLKEPRATKPLAAMLNHPEEMIRTLAATALAFKDNTKASKALCETLKRRDKSAAAAARALAHIGDPRTLKPLMSAAVHGNFEAVLALGQIGDPRAAPALVKLISDPTEDFLFSAEFKTITQILHALKWQPDDSEAALYYALCFPQEAAETIIAFGNQAANLLIFIATAKGETIGSHKYTDEDRQSAAEGLGLLWRADVLSDEIIDEIIKLDDLVIRARTYQETSSTGDTTIHTEYAERYQLRWYLDAPEDRIAPTPEILDQRKKYDLRPSTGDD